MNRRQWLVAAGLASAAPAGAATRAAPSRIADDLQRYHDFGPKLSGGPGDSACGEWMEQRLTSLGYRPRRQPFSIPYFDVSASTIAVEGQTIPVRPQAPWRATAPAGVEARLVAWPGDPAAVRGAIAVMVLPYRRWSAFRAPEVEPPVRAALAAGAAGVVLVTTGPTGEALALNVTPQSPPVSAPVVLLGPKAAAPVLKALGAGGRARLTVTGTGGERPAFNVAARLDRGADRWLVVSTPRSGWTRCAAERGGGVAVWLGLAAWARTAAPHLNVLMTSASGHEFEYAGAKLFLEHEAPPPKQTAYWLHLGANVAGRDWHEFPAGLSALPSADPQRVLVVEKGLLPAARRAFAGQPGLERPYSPEERADGELGEVLAAGHRAGGVFGGHRYHHAEGDDMRCVEPALVEAAYRGFRDLLAEALKTGQRS